MILAGGDDYELCFTAPVEMQTKIVLLSESLGLQLSHIGHITQSSGLIVIGLDNEVLNIKETGFDHFNQTA